MADGASFLRRPGLAGPFGALMDEYARAAEDFCRAVESVPVTTFTHESSGVDPNTTSVRALCAHAVSAAYRYADYIRRARALPFVDRYELDPRSIGAPGEVRVLLREAIHYTEEALDGLYDAPEETVAALTFRVRWGPVYDPEMILEHGIVHLLRHRRQLERWPGLAR